MKTSVRSIMLVALLSLAVTPTLSAETMGTNPKPGPWPPSAVLKLINYTVSLYFGI